MTAFEAFGVRAVRWTGSAAEVLQQTWRAVVCAVLCVCVVVCVCCAVLCCAVLCCAGPGVILIGGVFCIRADLPWVVCAWIPGIEICEGAAAVFRSSSYVVWSQLRSQGSGADREQHNVYEDSRKKLRVSRGPFRE